MTSQPFYQTHIDQYFKKSYQKMKFGLVNLIEYNNHIILSISLDQ